MSLPEELRLEKETFKPHLKYNIGDTVFLKTDTDKKWPMMIIDFDTEEDLTSDYFTKWMNSQGKTEQGNFPEECLIKDEPSK